MRFVPERFSLTAHCRIMQAVCLLACDLFVCVFSHVPCHVSGSLQVVPACIANRVLGAQKQHSSENMKAFLHNHKLYSSSLRNTNLKNSQNIRTCTVCVWWEGLLSEPCSPITFRSSPQKSALYLTADHSAGAQSHHAPEKGRPWLEPCVRR